MIPFTIVATLLLTAALFVVSQHGWGNTLLSLGMLLYDAGTRFNQRSERRRREVVRQWIERLEAAE
jgi:hypothetical protein